MKTKLLTLLAAAAVCTTSAIAQVSTTTTVESGVPAPAVPTVVEETTTTTTQLASGHVIMDSTGAELGKVQRVIEYKSRPSLVVVQTGDRQVLVPYRTLTVNGDVATYTASRELITTAPVYEEKSVYTTTEQLSPVYKHYNVEFDDGEMEIEEIDD